MSAGCIFCRIADGEIPAELHYQDEEILAFADIDPQAPVHVLVIPRRHVDNLLALDEADSDLLGRLYGTAVALARQFGLAESGFRVVCNCLTDGGQSVDHLHVHLLGGRRMGWPPG